jgi:hypothetical protein
MKNNTQEQRRNMEGSEHRYITGTEHKERNKKPRNWKTPFQNHNTENSCESTSPRIGIDGRQEKRSVKKCHTKSMVPIELKSFNIHLKKFSVVHSDRPKHVYLNPKHRET